MVKGVIAVFGLASGCGVGVDVDRSLPSDLVLSLHAETSSSVGGPPTASGQATWRAEIPTGATASLLGGTGLTWNLNAPYSLTWTVAGGGHVSGPEIVSEISGSFTLILWAKVSAVLGLPSALAGAADFQGECFRYEVRR